MSVVSRLGGSLIIAAALLTAASGQPPSSAGLFGLRAAPAQASSVQLPAPAPTTSAQPQRSAFPPSPAIDELRRDLREIIGSPSIRNASTSVLVVSLDRGDTLFAANPDLPLAPASNMKLFTTAAALYYLGPNFRFSTYTLADGEIRDGALYGDLVLYGTGDPTISSRMLPGALTPLRGLVEAVVAEGITEIHGDVVGDGSYFDDTFIAEGWRERYRLASYSAPIGALSLAENIVGIRVLPGAAGQPAQIRTTPSTEGLLIQNRVTTVGSGGSSVRFSYDPAGLIVEGRIARGHPGVARTVTVVDPANFAAAAYRTVLEEAGVRVHGTVRTIRQPERSPIGRSALALARDGEGASAPRVIGSHLSPPLSEVITVTNHFSQNLFAEALFKTVGRIALGDGTFAGGALAVQYFLECEKPLDFSGMRIVDGSGLSPVNRVTTRTTIHLLDLMTRTDVWDAFYTSLPEAASPNGGRHSLRSRMGGTAAARNLRAKTGTISNVSGLSGYVHAGNGELLAFSIFVNDIGSTWQAKRAEDAIGARLARFTRPPAEPTAPAADAPADPERVPSPDADAPQDSATESAAGEDPATQEATPPAAPATRTHTISSGETLDGIARRYGTTVSEIERLNSGIQPRRLQLGQVITIPGP
ncbi:MAG: D-alanyl-D-alanine carboxypeptidase/D-alanyl-D-alanine-endopeptidase [Gemmatimonadota bacterium]